MKKYSCNLLRMYLLLLFSYLVQPIYAQSIYKIDSVLYVTPNLESESKEIVQVMPCFPGGQQGLMQWIDNNFQVPKEAIRDRVNGKTIVSYVVSKTGEVINVKILKSIPVQKMMSRFCIYEKNRTLVEQVVFIQAYVFLTSI